MHALMRDKTVPISECRGSALRLARWLRRTRALFLRSMTAGAVLPRFFGSVLLSSFFLLVLLFGIIVGGHGEQTAKMLTASLGLAVSKVHITGIEQTSEIDVLTAMGLDGDSAMLMFDMGQAREQILALPWVQSVILRKNYPDQLHVAIIERRPLALWQHQGRLDVIDEKGEAIVSFSAGQASILGHALKRSLPLLVGRGANLHGAEILTRLGALGGKFDNFQSRIRAYRRVGDRRWDLVLDNGVEIKLPEHHFEARLAHMLALDGAQDLLSPHVLSVDLRLDDRMSVALSDEALARWREQVNAQEKARKQARQKAERRG